MAAGKEVAAKQSAGPPGCKICCACPAERRARDECVILKGVDACKDQVEAFYACLLREGFTEEDVNSLRKSAKSF
ncbi:putative cytochrome c oxidase copper chaperone [Trypanosoma cruzi]|uniref:Cytochrome c oxidase copper chaperone, putative n=2 Tax=Trypanosoma cruzi TaxID=5693 RepID=Q4E5Z7_TRYCC|nr:cytochrome c oxidase copper chaperone, putative [Trypanosoma cruzi]EAO00265.1 cytochrome c oxidase copper chaperone, putative [Trypanosoma cruzi]PWV18215.1 putative cytochrome c oxidase copper chaperone [Trypanosoma cruzi]|eukprot:XP_822116.1 cytochrome c oxidase copper chaperone [Trypanosoma cruzi strain CL Brener]